MERFMSKTVLVTGGAGFIAHHVIENILRNTDWNVVSLDRLDFSGNLNRLHDMMDEFDAETRKRCFDYARYGETKVRRSKKP